MGLEKTHGADGPTDGDATLPAEPSVRTPTTEASAATERVSPLSLQRTDTLKSVEYSNVSFYRFPTTLG